MAVINDLIDLSRLSRFKTNCDALYSTKVDSAHSLELAIDSSTYILTATLKNSDGTVLGIPATIDLPLETMVVGGSYNTETKEVVLSLKDGSTIKFSVADLISGLQSEITSTNKLSADLIQDGTTNKVFTATDESNLNSNTSARHTHGNKSILDNTTASYTTAEQSKLAGLSNYTLPIANANTLGGVKPEAKTSSQTQAVGVDSTGKLYTLPAGTGPQGPAGAAGADGADGADGYTFTPSINSNGDLSWSKTQGAGGNAPATVNIKGPSGADGKDGTNATITNVTASVNNSVGTPSVVVSMGGTESARTFNFAFSNLKGAKGDPGTNGADGTDGANGYTFTPSIDDDGNLTWTKAQGSGGSVPVSVNIKGPKGDKGDTGSVSSVNVTGSGNVITDVTGTSALTFTKGLTAQAQITSTNKLSADLVQDGTTNKVFTATDESNLSANTSARHTHSNKSILDGITASYTTAEQSKLAGIAANANNYVHPSTHPASMITGLATVATSGSYTDLSNTPTIDSELSSTSTNAVQNKVIYNTFEQFDTTVNSAIQEAKNEFTSSLSSVTQSLNNKVDKVSGKQLSTNDFTNDYKSKIDGLATVATSGSYTDLSDKPTIPTIPNISVSDTASGTYITDITSSGHTITVSRGSADTALNARSTNPISNAAVYSALDTTSAQITNLQNNKVDKVTGKELSTNDFTDDYKTKLDGIATNANNYSLPVATSTTLGGVKPLSQTSSMTQSVGVDSSGRLYAQSNVNFVSGLMEGTQQSIDVIDYAYSKVCFIFDLGGSNSGSLFVGTDAAYINMFEIPFFDGQVITVEHFKVPGNIYHYIYYSYKTSNSSTTLTYKMEVIRSGFQNLYFESDSLTSSMNAMFIGFNIKN